MKTYFEVPTQVRFHVYNTLGNEYGIAYHDEIICASCPHVFKIAEVKKITELTWIDFENVIAE